jgi:hypothetical protein
MRCNGTAEPVPDDESDVAAVFADGDSISKSKKLYFLKMNTSREN